MIGWLLLAAAALLLVAALRLRRSTGMPWTRVRAADTGSWRRLDAPLRSQRYALVGRPDYVLDTRDGSVPVEVKPGRRAAAPYDSDVLQLAAYCLLLEDSEGRAPRYGLLRYAEHTFQGFSTGVWEGNMLTITTTHLKTNYYRRNGVPASDRRTVVEHWTRHAEFLTVVTVVTDPVFLTEPLVRSQNWFNDVGQALPAFTCEYATEVPGAQKVPNHLPGANPYLTEFADWYGLELAATRGGADTMYPEYRQKMGAPHSKPPDRCQRYCTCGGGFNCDVNPPRPPAK